MSYLLHSVLLRHRGLRYEQNRSPFQPCGDAILREVGAAYLGGLNRLEGFGFWIQQKETPTYTVFLKADSYLMLPEIRKKNSLIWAGAAACTVSPRNEMRTPSYIWHSFCLRFSFKGNTGQQVDATRLKR